MLVIVSYDVSTISGAGRRRLRQVAKTCLNYGQRVQCSVFECDVEPDQWVRLKNALERLIDPTTDSLRYYYLGAHWKRRVEHFGAKPSIDLDAPLVI